MLVEDEIRYFLIENKKNIRKYFGMSYYEDQLNTYFMSYLIKNIIKKCCFLSQSAIKTMTEDKYKIIHKLFSFIKAKDIPDETKRLFQERELELFVKEGETRLKCKGKIPLKNNFVYLIIKTIPRVISNKINKLESNFMYDFDVINNEKKYKEINEMLSNYFITLVFLNEFRLLHPKGYPYYSMTIFKNIMKKEEEKYRQNEENIKKCKILSDYLPMDICKHIIYPYLK